MEIKSREDSSEWPHELDALVAAPGNHKLLFENETVRVLDTTVLPGETTPVHTHKYPASLYIESWSDFIRYDEKGNVLLDSRTLDRSPKPGDVLWSSPLEPHSLKNTGNTEIKVIAFEIKK